MEPSSESLTGPDGRTSAVGKALAKELAKAANTKRPVTNVRQDGYGSSSFDVDMGDKLIASVTVEVRRDVLDRT